MPLIAPPTPPQLEQDKASVDESFNKAFVLLDQLATDTAALKASEESRTQRLDAALAEMESVITSLKDSSKRRDDDSRRMEDDMRNLRDLIPKAMDAHKESTAAQLKELSTELKGLKTLVASRVGGTSQPTNVRPTSVSGMYTAPTTGGVNGIISGAVTPSSENPSSGGPVGGSNNNVDIANGPTSSGVPDRVQSSTPYGRMMNGKASIPAWQLAASQKNKVQETEKKDTSDSGTITETNSDT
jgi:peroxin-14